MPWSGSWNPDKTVYTGTYTAPDGTVFAGTWTVSQANSDTSDPPTLSYYDPYVGRIGAATDDSSSVERAWDVKWESESYRYSGAYSAPDGSVFNGTITPPQDARSAG